MSAQPMFKPNGDQYDVSPAGVLLLAAITAFGDPAESTPEGIRRALMLVDGTLSAAFSGGFTQCDILRTLLERNQPTRRVKTMAEAACMAAGTDAIQAVWRRVGLS
jgi:hypothetical protein